MPNEIEKTGQTALTGFLKIIKFAGGDTLWGFACFTSVFAWQKRCASAIAGITRNNGWLFAGHFCSAIILMTLAGHFQLWS